MEEYEKFFVRKMDKSSPLVQKYLSGEIVPWRMSVEDLESLAEDPTIPVAALPEIFQEMLRRNRHEIKIRRGEW